MHDDRRRILRESAAFLAGGGMRPRAVVVVGERGIGKTTFLDLLQVEVLAAGRRSVVVVDDAQVVDDAGIAMLRERVLADTRTAVLVAHDGSASELTRMVDSLCERRVVEIPPLGDEAARALLVELGLQPWTLRARQVLAASGGVPRELVDRSFQPLDLAALPVVDTSFAGDAWSGCSARRLELAFTEDAASLDALYEELDGLIADADAVPEQLADALAARSEAALIEHDLEAAVQLGERATTIEAAPERVRIVAASNASGARALRGEPTAMLSMHALAGRASRAGLPVVEGYVWYGIACTAGTMGDVTTAERAAARAIQLFDQADAVLLGLRAREALADLHLAAGRADVARSYLEEIRVVAEARGLHRLRITAMSSEVRAGIALGDHEAACRLADETLELVLRSRVSRADVVYASIYAARAYAQAGSVDLALSPLEALANQLGDSSTPDFWLVLEAVRVLGKAGTDPAAFRRWAGLMGGFDADGHGGALRAAHAEVDAWSAAAEGRRAEAARLADRARQLWVVAECHDELPLTEPLVQGAPLEHGPRIQLVGSASAGPSAPAEDPEAFAVLTKREREIARYVAGGLTNPEIATELHLSPRTVEHHVASILRKLELPSRRELVRGRV